ncbi:hypothetical protein [Microseira sp. BLCC-F43]|uniref:hypothetical protein n=1 Tax=Microseira sp. BLCC-F43 TaxID=3153602 RepID=UPI0035B82CF1
MGLTHAILVYYISLAVVAKDAIAIGATRSHSEENRDAIAWWGMGTRSPISNT